MVLRYRARKRLSGLTGTCGAVAGRWRGRIRSLLRDQCGATATEYAIMLALVIFGAIGVITTMGGKVSSTFGTVDTAMADGSGDDEGDGGEDEGDGGDDGGGGGQGHGYGDGTGSGHAYGLDDGD